MKDKQFLEAERNYLAAERTFLSWIRTGLAGVGGGIALIRFLPFTLPLHQAIAYAVGLLLVVWGMSLFVLSTLEYEKASAQLQKISPDLKIKKGWKRVVVITLLVLSLVLFFLLLIPQTNA